MKRIISAAVLLALVVAGVVVTCVHDYRPKPKRMIQRCFDNTDRYYTKEYYH